MRLRRPEKIARVWADAEWVAAEIEEGEEISVVVGGLTRDCGASWNWGAAAGCWIAEDFAGLRQFILRLLEGWMPEAGGRYTIPRVDDCKLRAFLAGELEIAMAGVALRDLGGCDNFV